MTGQLTIVCGVIAILLPSASGAEKFELSEDGDQIKIVTPELEAAIQKKGYVSGVAGGSLVNRKTGFRDAGFGLDIVDWIMEPGSDVAYRDQLDQELVYRFNTTYHGKTAKRSIEGPQICTQARELRPRSFAGVTSWRFACRTITRLPPLARRPVRSGPRPLSSRRESVSSSPVIVLTR